MRSKKAYEIYKKWVENHQYKGLSYCLAYEDEPIEDFEKMLTRFLKKISISRQASIKRNTGRWKRN